LWAWANAQLRTGKGPVYLYSFDHRPPLPDAPAFQNMGAIHGAEVAYVFGNLSWPATFQYTAEDRTLSETLMSYWTNFARSGNPNGAGLPRWRALSLSDPAVMHFNSQIGMGAPNNLQRLKALDGYDAWRRGRSDAN